MFPPNICTGCGACAQLCPTHAIRMERDNEGFFYPVVNEDECVHCYLCEQKCPVLTPNSTHACQPEAYASQNCDEEARIGSSSGGVFSLLAKYVLRQGGLVIGCAMTNDCYNAEHRAITDEQELYALRGSKYLQSRADITFPQVKGALLNQQWVLFSGTPCQVLGLYAYLSGVNTERLISVDIICHGAPSPEVWKKYIKHFEEVKASKVVSVQFRNKEKGWKNYALVLDFENGETYRNICTKDLYSRGFVADLFLRRSCYACEAKGLRRAADITLGDLWGIHHLCPCMDDNRGTSLVLLNTHKGEELFQQIQADAQWKKLDFEETIKHNPSYYNSSARIAYRNYFMEHACTKNVVKLLEDFFDLRVMSRIKRKLIGLLPMKIVKRWKV